ncbi:hypothetical protein BDL97_16G069400 [Sphagnum fallax]|nr:hypothetical protein BDL97_16G069400 [Sphagnum fallax]
MSEATVSCADILAIAVCDAVFLSGGPFWNVELGRQAGTTASKAAADNSIPTPLANVLQFVSRFNAVGLSEQDVAVLAGAHTNGKARYTSFQAQLHEQNGKGQPDPSLKTSCLHKLQHLCPAQNGDSNQTTNLDLCTPTPFDTSTTRICRLRMSSCFQMRYCLPHLVIASPSLTCMQVARRHSSITLLHQC